MSGRFGFELPEEVVAALADAVAERIASRLGPATATTTPWLTADEAAAHLGLAKSSLYRLARSGAVPGYQDGPGARVYFHRDELDQARRSAPV